MSAKFIPEDVKVLRGYASKWEFAGADILVVATSPEALRNVCLVQWQKEIDMSKVRFIEMRAANPEPAQ